MYRFSKSILFFFFLIIGFIFSNCLKSPERTLFKSLSADSTGIHFANTVLENDSVNILDNEYVYNGGGVATGDLNGDGLQDIFFTGNIVSNKLYLNLGHMKFKDITKISGLEKVKTWSTGVSLMDINQDGKLDILICNSIYKDSTRLGTYLYINQGNDKNGIPFFKEMAKEYGLNDKGHNVQAAFIDYDHDGDLDVIFITNVIQDYPNQFKPKTHDGKSPTVDKLYRNDWDSVRGHPVFHEVSKEAGIVEEGYSHGVSIADFNGDGWDDIYISNDYLSNDILYVNNHDGTFTNRINDYFKHQSYSAMGNDVADLNNDGLPDIFTTEMLPNENKRKKLMLAGNNYQNLILDSIYGFQREYIRNTLQLNQGPSSDTANHPVFSEIAMLSGVYQTDWSWCPLIADFNNDGKRDLYVTNGFPKDVTDHDFSAFRGSYGFTVFSKAQTLKLIPSVKIPNFIFQNEGNLHFADKTRDWGLKISSFSNGAAYADLDNDGYLDLVVNNMDSTAFVFKNMSKENKLSPNNHFLRIKLKGTIQNPIAIGAKVYIYPKNSPLQYTEQNVCHGYLSNSESILHFGLGKSEILDSIRIIWPEVLEKPLVQNSVSGKSIFRKTTAKNAKQKQGINTIPVEYRTQLLKNITGDRVLNLDIQNAHFISGIFNFKPKEKSILTETHQERNINYTHTQYDFIDFNIQHTLPHKYSEYGPGIAVGDINGDGLEDFFIGSEMGHPAYIFYQQKNGTFKQVLFTGNSNFKSQDDLGSILFDADGDGDLDLYITSGGFEKAPGSKEYQDRLYINDGKGNFRLAENAIPNFTDSKLCVRVADYDGDGKLDLLISTKVIPGAYPLPGPTYILHNDSKGKDNPHFTDVTARVCPSLKKAGLISDALWTDFNNDGKLDFILCGEWAPIQFFEQKDGKFINISATSGVNGKVGWWNSITAGDFDGDGDIDYIVGNLGLNTPFQGSSLRPVDIYAADFDHNGTLDPLIETYVQDSTGNFNPYPYHSRDDIFRQILPLKKKFLKYGDYGKARMKDLISDSAIKKSLHYSANWFYSSYLENKGNGHFIIHPLPIEAQFAPIFGMQAYDIDQDGNLDVLCTGNEFGCELLSGNQDALQGLVLRGNGKGGFLPMALEKSGLYIPGDGRALSKLIDGKGNTIFLASQNKGPLKCFEDKTARFTNSSNNLKPMDGIWLKTLDQYALITLKNGKTKKEEFYYGSSFISQSSRYLHLNPNYLHVVIFDSQNKRRILF